MASITRVYIHAPIDQVWTAITDHEGMATWPGIRRAALRRPGRTERNGLGAVREIHLGRVRFVEEIVGFQPPFVMEYKIVETNAPIEHDEGRITLIPRGDGTEIHWMTRFRVTLPFVGKRLTRLLEVASREAFTRALMTLKDRLEAESA